ncbi:MAG: Glu-tRNA(Gln) amidotransferase subunit GatE [Candidatus ainarchaeum sp.]|nr:Glu-tRNA(Gln) amidotransferase subunit GatE [Candidatus ainarchaeum sp.]
MKCGLEIHQRLDTGKLFCRCSSTLADTERSPEYKLKRRLRASAGEMGELDIAARMEQEKEKEFHYDGFFESCCLVEADEEPPLDMDAEALRIVLGIAQQLHMDVCDELHVMRKIVVDGSNTSGFQRTCLVATGGYLETSKGKVRISTVAVEEESSGIVAEEAHIKHYRLDRLGIPLIELATEPDILDAEHCKETAEKIGLILRATGKVARGIGTIRQDVNVSTERGARVEIKGAQDLRTIPLYVQNEVKRQEELLRVIGEVGKRIGDKEIKPKVVDLTKTFAKTECGLIKKGLESGGHVLGIRLEGHEGLIGRELVPGRRYGTELSDYAKSAGVKGIIHSDEDFAKYKISDAEKEAVRKALGVKKGDAFAMVVAHKTTAERALHRVLERANMRRVPEETRKANQDGTSSFMRPLAGRARMYPETDLQTIEITDKLLGEAKAAAGGGLEEKEKKLRAILNPEMAGRMLRSRNLQLFEELVEAGAEPMLAAGTLEQTLVELRREGLELARPREQLMELFAEYGKGLFVKAAIPEILRGMCGGKKVREAAKGLERISGAELKKLVKEKKDFGAIMREYRLRVDAGELKKAMGGE